MGKENGWWNINCPRVKNVATVVDGSERRGGKPACLCSETTKCQDEDEAVKGEDVGGEYRMNVIRPPSTT